MSLDSIDEGSMVGLQFNQILNVNGNTCEALVNAVDIYSHTEVRIISPTYIYWKMKVTDADYHALIYSEEWQQKL